MAARHHLYGNCLLSDPRAAATLRATRPMDGSLLGTTTVITWFLGTRG